MRRAAVVCWVASVLANAPACATTCFDTCRAQQNECLDGSSEPGQEYVCERRYEQCSSSCPIGPGDAY